MTDKKTIKKLLALFLTLSIAVSQFICFSVSAENDKAEEIQPYDGVTSVMSDKKGKKLTVTVNLSESFTDEHKKSDVYLFELGVGMTEYQLDQLEPVDSFRVTSKHVYKTDLHRGAMSRLFSSYVLAVKVGEGNYVPVGHRRYIENIPEIAKYNYTYPDAVSKKGLEISSVSDALDLGISHAVIPVRTESAFMSSSGTNSIDYDFSGITYHFNRELINSLDDKILTLSKNRVRIYLRFELNTAPTALSSFIAGLGYRDAPECTHYALNVKNSTGASLLSAFFSFLAERYTDPSAKYGFCGSFIIGQDVNLPSLCYSCSPSVTPEDYIENYVLLTRIAYTALCSVYKNGRVFISTANNFSMVPAGLTRLNMSTADFLSAFGKEAAATGDFNWSVSTSAYAYSRADSSIWDDALATGASSQLISPANINVFSYFISKNYTFGGSPRRFIIGAFTVPDNQKGAEQAASYLYAYYKTIEDGKADALIYSSQFDRPDSSETYGLSITDVSGNVLRRKPVWEILRTADGNVTSPAETLCNSVGGVLKYLFDSQKDKASVKQWIYGTASASSADTDDPSKIIYDFSAGDRHGFVNTGRGFISSPSLIMSENNIPSLEIARGNGFRTVKYDIERTVFNGTDNVIINLAGCPSAGKITLGLSQDGKLFYKSSISFAPGTKSLNFEVTGFTDLMSKGNVTMSISLDSGEGQFALSSVGTLRKTSVSSVILIVLLILVTIFALMLVIALFTRAYHSHRRKRSRSSLPAKKND